MDEVAPAMDALLDRLVAVLSSGGSAESRDGSSGQAADGLVTAVVSPDGHLDSLQLDPKLLRTPGAIGAAIVDAVNAALATMPEAGPATSRTQALQSIQQDSLALSEQLSASLITTLETLSPS